MQENINQEKINIAMLGTGYVGLVSGVCFAELGFNVVCIDNDAAKIKALTQGRIPIFEPLLEEMVQRHFANQQIHFTQNLEDLKNCQVIFIAVGTPPNKETGMADLQFIKAAIADLAPLLNEHKTIVIKSTVPVGTCRSMAALIKMINPKAEFDIVSNPEFLREGSAVYDFMNPDRIILGSEKTKAVFIMEIIYRSFAEKGIPLVHTDLETAEMIKYGANCFLATKLAFVNEIATLCEQTGANVESVMRGIGLDPRIGALYLKAGPGFGGSCFPKDTLALSRLAKEKGKPLQIVEAVLKSNEDRKHQMVDKIVTASGGVAAKTIAILGLAFKSNTDDVRDSAALLIIDGLQQQGATIKAFDPKAMRKAEEVLSNVYFAHNVYEAIEGADLIVIVTEWEEFHTLDFLRMKTLLKPNPNPPLLVDLRNLYDPNHVTSFGFRYVSIGRSVKEPEKISQEHYATSQ